MHRPQHQVIPIARVSNEQCVVDPPPIQSVSADGMSDEIVIWQHEMKQVVQAVVEQDIHIANRFPAAGGF